jgi:hypothetical protein
MILPKEKFLEKIPAIIAGSRFVAKKRHAKNNLREISVRLNYVAEVRQAPHSEEPYF